ncbi:aldo/keto reductase [Actinomadura nitritigenes]|uniref:Aldo/keto reductase n=1 Tax=Actinomadura nitritigenes TaxID=134602 RepID=A0ABS3REK0_9ACTN|nr:aldo/keto reductase [Actinomadura nitritigenes]
MDERTALEPLDRCADAGGTLIDTANCYAFWSDPDGAGGHSEGEIGQWPAGRPGIRDRMRLSTRAGARPVGDGECGGRGQPPPSALRPCRPVLDPRGGPVGAVGGGGAGACAARGVRDRGPPRRLLGG